MSEDILATLVSRVKKSEFYFLQVDESTDVANLANLLVYVRYLFEGTVQEDVFMRTNGIDWECCVGIWLIAHIWRVCPSISWLYCSVHRGPHSQKHAS